MPVAISSLVSALPSTTEKPAVPPTETQAVLRQIQAEQSKAQDRLVAAQKAEAATVRPETYSIKGAPQAGDVGTIGVNITV